MSFAGYARQFDYISDQRGVGIKLYNLPVAQCGFEASNLLTVLTEAALS